MKLLVVDTDRDLVEMLTSWLKTVGFEVYRAYTVDRAKTLWLEQLPDVVIIDTAMRDTDALAMCRDVRAKHDALILVLTEGKDIQDEVRCLESGVDDYLRKPFSPSQLLARIRALSRRSRSTLERRPSSVVTVGPLRVDALHNEASIYGRTARLTPTESKLLHLLAINANDVCTSEQIVTHVWGYDGEGDSGLIKAHIRHLRQKIETDPGNPHFILTIAGVGYTLVRRPLEEHELKEAARQLRVVSM